ncbi:MAG: hypothetical protein Q7S32_00985 [bacterium]|nr:hypothetical protein [bacterium]
MKDKRQPFYIYMDIEGVGPLVSIHSMLSWAACVVTPEPYTKLGLEKRGFVFYDELAPISGEYEIEAMRIGCLGLRCLDLYKSAPEFDARSLQFNPALVLEVLRNKGTEPTAAMAKLREWLAKVVPDGFRPELVTDTVIFDASHINYYLSAFGGDNLFGHSGLDINSYCRGFFQSRSASLKTLGIVDDRLVPHCAEDDAIFGSKLARELLFNRSKP